MAYQPIPTKNEDDVHASGDAGLPILGVRQDTDGSPVSADGDYHALQFNSAGRLKVSTLPGDYAAITGNITSAASTVAADVSRASNVNIYVTGTFAGVNFTFEGSIDNGTTYFGVQAVRTNANTVETTSGVIAAAPAYAWELSVNALTHVRVRATAWTSGTAVVRILPGAYATEPIPAIQTHPVTMTTTTLSGGTTAVTGETLFRDAAVTNTDVAVKAATNGRMYSYYCYNPGTADAWVHFYNALIANVTVGTTVPVYSVLVPAGGTSEAILTIPKTFATGMTVAATTSYVHTVSTAPGTALLVEVGYF